MEKKVRKIKNQKLLRYKILGSRRFSNYWWSLTLFLSSVAFLVTGFSSYQKENFFSFLNSANITFFPQGLVMCFYGGLGLLYSIFLLLTVFWDVGSGFNEFNKKNGKVRIFRWGFPGKNRRIDFFYNIKDIEAIKVEMKESFNPKNVVSLKIKGKKNIPLTGIGPPSSLEEIEKEASDLAFFLNIDLEGILK